MEYVTIIVYLQNIRNIFDMAKTNRSKSYIAILSAAKDLFWRFGIRKTSVEDICKAAGVSKMTFYRSFDNKFELARVMLEDLMETNIQRYRDIVAKDISYPDKIKEMILMKHQAATEISKEFMEEAYINQEFGLAPILHDYRQKTLKMVMDDFSQAQKEGHIRKDMDLNFILYILNFLSSDAFINDQFLAMYDNMHDAIMEVTNFFFYGVMEPQNNKP